MIPKDENGDRYSRFRPIDQMCRSVIGSRHGISAALSVK